MNPKPINVSVLNEFKLMIHFENGEEKIFDMEPYLKYPVYEDLNDTNFFSEARVEYGTVMWDKEIDIDPDRLYLESYKK